MSLAITALLAVVAASALAFVVVVGARARAIAALGRRLEAEPLEPVSGAPQLVPAVPAVHLRTLVSGRDACLVELPEGLDGALSVTERELLLTADTTLHVSMRRILEAGYLASFEGVDGRQGVLLAVVWRRAGERLTSVFLVRARRHDVEKIRREIHLRQERPEAWKA